MSGSGARLGDGQLTPNRGFDAGSSTDAGSSQGASQDDDWRNAPPMGVTADNRIEPNQVLDEATKQVEGDWEFYDRAGEVLFVVATTVFTGGAAWFGRGAIFGKTGAGATEAVAGTTQVAPRILGICFAEGTLVHTSDGLKAIEEVAIGDLVWAWDEETEELSLRRVMRLFETPNQPLVEVTIAHDDGAKETIRATLEHPFWTEDGWIPANELVPGARVLLWSGGWSKVGSVHEADKVETVYNFEVETLHSYFVGEAGTLVHNQSAISATRALQAADLGLSGRGIVQLAGTVTNAGTTRIIHVANIEATRGALAGQLQGALPAILRAARAEGVKTLQISGTFANPALRSFAAKQAAAHGGTFSSQAGVEVLTFVF